MLYTIAALLLLFWIIGFAIHLGGALIHILLVAAVVVFLFNLLTGRGARL